VLFGILVYWCVYTPVTTTIRTPLNTRAAGMYLVKAPHFFTTPNLYPYATTLPHTRHLSCRLYLSNPGMLELCSSADRRFPVKISAIRMFWPLSTNQTCLSLNYEDLTICLEPSQMLSSPPSVPRDSTK
jgi:hypothetical protein